MSMRKPLTPVLFDKFVDIANKIGRKKKTGDERLAILYVALTEYVKTIEPEILKKPEYATIKGKDTKDKNPDYLILEVIKKEINNIDHNLRLSLWAKE
jgi:hypothetical protein